MSGSGGGDDWRPLRDPGDRPTPDDEETGAGPGGDPDLQDDPCNIVENTTLNSPVREVISKLGVGTTLGIQLQLGPPRRLLAVADDGSVAGSITSPNSGRIIECLAEGRSFRATVRYVRGGICAVLVHRA